MALNGSSGESAVLEIEVDVSGFDQLDKRVADSANKATKNYQMMGNEVRKTFAQQKQTEQELAALQEKRSRAQKEAYMRMAAAAAVYLGMVKKTFDAVKAGGGEAAQRIEQLEKKFDALKASIGRAVGESGRFQESLALLEMVTGSADGITSAFNSIPQGASHAVSAIQAFAGAAQNALGPVMWMVNEIRRAWGIYGEAVARAADERAGMEGAEQQAFDSQRADTRARQRLAENARAAERARVAADNAATARITMKVAEGYKHAGGGGGGGGGGDDWEAKQAAMREQELAWRIKAEEGRHGDVRPIPMLAMESGQEEYAQSLIDAETKLAQAHDNGVKSWVESEKIKQEMLNETLNTMSDMTQASIQSATATMLSTGSFDKAARSALASLSMMAGTKAIFELAEGIGALAVTWGVPNPSATGHFAAAAMFGGIALGAVGVGKAAYGSSFGKQSNGKSGGGGAGDGIGGGGMSSPRGSSGGGGGPINVTLVLNAAGEVVDDSALRRLGRAISEIERRGYVARGN